MACLIYRNLIKGYFAHKSKVLVLSKRPLPETEREACLVTES
jgi:nuclear mRNA export protein PCID2/THP1